MKKFQSLSTGRLLKYTRRSFDRWLLIFFHCLMSAISSGIAMHCTCLCNEFDWRRKRQIISLTLWTYDVRLLTKSKRLPWPYNVINTSFNCQVFLLVKNRKGKLQEKTFKVFNLKLSTLYKWEKIILVGPVAHRTVYQLALLWVSQHKKVMRYFKHEAWKSTELMCPTLGIATEHNTWILSVWSVWIYQQPSSINVGSVRASLAKSTAPYMRTIVN